MGKQIAEKLACLVLEKQNSGSCTENRQVLPFILYTCCGHLFHTNIRIQNVVLKTPFFTVHSVDLKKSSAVLNILVPYPFQTGNTELLYRMQSLIRTNRRMVVDLFCFIGFMVVPAAVDDYVVVPWLLKEQIRLPFQLNNTGSVLWRTLEKEINNTATVLLHYRAGSDSSVNLILYTENRTVSLSVPLGRARAITVSNLHKIEIQQPVQVVNGMIDLQLNRYKQQIIHLD